MCFVCSRKLSVGVACACVCGVYVCVCVRARMRVCFVHMHPQRNDMQTDVKTDRQTARGGDTNARVCTVSAPRHQAHPSSCDKLRNRTDSTARDIQVGFSSESLCVLGRPGCSRRGRYCQGIKSVQPCAARMPTPGSVPSSLRSPDPSRLYCHLLVCLLLLDGMFSIFRMKY